MSEPLHAQVERYEEGGQTRVAVRGRLDHDAAPAVFEWLQAWLPREPRRVGLDLGEISYLDSAGVAVLAESYRLATERGIDLRLVKISEPARRTLTLFRASGRADEAALPPPGLLESLGLNASGWLEEGRQLLLLLADTFYWALFGPFSAERGAPKGEVGRQSLLLGHNAFGIIALLSTLIGVTLALLSAQQLRLFGANIYVADLVAVAMVKEMGPMLTAIIVAGRSGSAIAAEISTMMVTEEVDALQAMGFSTVRFLVVPKLYAVTVAQPLLTQVSVAFGMMGGMIIAAISLQIPPPAFLHQSLAVIGADDLFTGILKSMVFGWLILLLAAHNGLRTRGGAEAVGLSTTRSVVMSIFAVIIADCIFSLALYL